MAQQWKRYPGKGSGEKRKEQEEEKEEKGQEKGQEKEENAKPTTALIRWAEVAIEPGTFRLLYSRHGCREADFRSWYRWPSRATSRGMLEQVWASTAGVLIPSVPLHTLPAVLRDSVSCPRRVLVQATLVRPLDVAFGKGTTAQVARLSGATPADAEAAIWRKLRGQNVPSALSLTITAILPQLDGEPPQIAPGSSGPVELNPPSWLAWTEASIARTWDDLLKDPPFGTKPAYVSSEGLILAVDPTRQTLARVVSILNGAVHHSLSFSHGPTFALSGSWNISNYHPDPLPDDPRSRVRVLANAAMAAILHGEDAYADPPKLGAPLWGWRYDKDRKVHTPANLSDLLRIALDFGAIPSRELEPYAFRPERELLERSLGVVRWADATTLEGRLLSDDDARNIPAVRYVPWSYFPPGHGTDHGTGGGFDPEPVLVELDGFFPLGRAASLEFLRFVKLVLTSDTSTQKFLHLQGLPKQGKGTLMRVLEALLPAGMTARINAADFGDDPKLAAAIGKMLVISDETRYLSNAATSVVQTITEGGRVTTNRKYRDAAEIGGFLLISAANSPFGGAAYDATKGMARRLVNLEVRRAEGSTVVPDYAPRFVEAFGQTLVWAALTLPGIFGADDDVSRASKRLVEEDPIQDFIDEWLVPRIESGLPSTVADTFIQWRKRNEPFGYSQSHFGKEMSRRGFQSHTAKINGKCHRIYRRIPEDK